MNYKEEYLSQFDNDVQERANEIVAKSNFRGVEYTYDGEWYSVLVATDDYCQWIDIKPTDDGIISDWNKYIFYTMDFNDMVDKCVQGYCNEDGDAIMVEAFENAAEEYLSEIGITFD